MPGRHVPERDVDQRHGLRDQRRVERAQPVPQGLALQRRAAHHLRQQVAKRFADRAVERVRAAHGGAGDALQPALRGQAQDRLGHELLAHLRRPGVALGLRSDHPHLRAIDRQLVHQPAPWIQPGSAGTDAFAVPAEMAQELAGARDPGCLEDLARRPGLDHPAAVEHDDAVADPAGEVHLVRHHDHGHALVGQRLHDAQHLAHRLRIERRGRLVEQHQLRRHRERAGDRDPLLLAAGELRRMLVGVVGEADLAQQLLRQHAPRAPAPRREP